MSNISAAQEDSLERLQRRAARICLRIPLFQPVHHSAILHCLAWATMSSRRKLRQLQLGHSIYYGDVPPHLAQPGLVQRTQPVEYDLRTPRVFALPTTRTTRHRDSPLNLASFYFNNLPPSIIAAYIIICMCLFTTPVNIFNFLITVPSIAYI